MSSVCTRVPRWSVWRATAIMQTAFAKQSMKKRSTNRFVIWDGSVFQRAVEFESACCCNTSQKLSQLIRHIRGTVHEGMVANSARYREAVTISINLCLVWLKSTMCFRSMRCLARQWHLSKLLSPRMRNLHVKPASGSGCRCTTTGTTLGDKMMYMQKNITQRTLGDKCWSHVFWQSLLSVSACIWFLMIGFRRIRPSLANRLFFKQIWSWHATLRWCSWGQPMRSACGASGYSSRWLLSTRPRLFAILSVENCEPALRTLAIALLTRIATQFSGVLSSVLIHFEYCTRHLNSEARAGFT